MLQQPEHSLLSALVERGGESYSSELLWYVRRRGDRPEPPAVLWALHRLTEQGLIRVLSEPIVKKGRRVKIEPSGLQALRENPVAEQAENSPSSSLTLFRYLNEMGLMERPPNPKPDFDPHKLNGLFVEAAHFFKVLEAWAPPFNAAERDRL